MKKLWFILGCFVLSVSLYSQFDSNKYEALLEAGDSLFQIKRFKESALAYSAALQMRAGNAPLIRCKTSRSWAMANERDSAFYYLELIAGSNRPTIPVYDNILTDSSFNNLHSDQRWRKFEDSIISNYRKIATAFANRIRSGHWTNRTNDGYDAARAWASAGEKDSAFGYLNNIINTDYNVFIDFPEINEDNYLLLLHGDERWQPLLDAVRKNWSWIKTTHSFTGPDIPMIATVDQASTFLKSDGKGSYKSGVDKVNCVDQHAYNLQLSGHAVWYL